MSQGVRLVALQLAVGMSDTEYDNDVKTVDDVLDTARKFYEFLMERGANDPTAQIIPFPSNAGVN